MILRQLRVVFASLLAAVCVDVATPPDDYVLGATLVQDAAGRLLGIS